MILGAGHLKSLKEAKKENTIYNRDQDHQKGKNGREVIHDLSVDHDLVHLTIMLENTTNSRKVGHNLQRKVLKDAANSGKVDHDLQRKVLKDTGNSREVDLNLAHLTITLKNTTNSRKVGHNLQRKVLKDATNSGKVDHDLQRKVLKDGTNQRKVGHNPQRKVFTTTVVSPQVAVNLSQQKSSLKNLIYQMVVCHDLPF